MPLLRLLKILLAVVFCAALVVVWLLFISATDFEEDKITLLIPSQSTYNDVLENVQNNRLVKYPTLFDWTAKALNYPERVKPGRYQITSGASMLDIIRMLRNGQQTPVNLVIGRWRTRYETAGKLGRYLEADSTSILQFLNSPDSLRAYGVDTNTVMTVFIQNTHSVFWTSPFSKLFKRLHQEQEKFWSETRKQKAQKLGLTPTQVFTLASIVEEETNQKADKGKIASVYLNRLQKGMRLGADPTVKFALQDFTLKRIYNKHTQFPSPYNTYVTSGLPPGPICLPSIQTIDAVLDAPTTPYLFFVAKEDFSGYSNFAETYEQHLVYARAYQQALDRLMAARNPSQP
jgi:UPF0755 protein